MESCTHQKLQVYIPSQTPFGNFIRKFLKKVYEKLRCISELKYTGRFKKLYF